MGKILQKVVFIVIFLGTTRTLSTVLRLQFISCFTLMKYRCSTVPAAEIISCEFARFPRLEHVQWTHFHSPVSVGWEVAYPSRKTPVSHKAENIELKIQRWMRSLCWSSNKYSDLWPHATSRIRFSRQIEVKVIHVRDIYLGSLATLRLSWVRLTRAGSRTQATTLQV
jgi:hypothetical protein